ncbi:MAG: hypothetical protein IPJ30_21025 [Acidobacteria bacterium]|nr:hypothetical protein [Acidobacteriota bacterium]MBK8147014.1 hypothetical protein [Acidobacteriota bacterium]
MLINRFDFQIDADFHQFYLEDESSPHGTDTIWDQSSFERMLGVGEKLIAVGTGRLGEVPVAVEIHDSAPETQIERYSRVNECSLEATSGRLVIAGCTDYLPDAARIAIESGFYRVRVLYVDLETVTDEIEGSDSYVLQLWKDSQMRDVEVLK